jgi:galactoside O-acetyltransferase
MAWLTPEQIAAAGFASVGSDVKLSDKASYYNCGAIHLGSHVRIDDFCVLSAGPGGIWIGNYIHIAVYCSLIGAERIELQDFSGLSSRVALYSSNDDYSGRTMTNPTVPEECRGVSHAAVVLERHALVGAGSVVLPGVTLREGSAVGALSLVRSDCDAFSIYLGVPAKRISSRKRGLLELEKRVPNP